MPDVFLPCLNKGDDDDDDDDYVHQIASLSGRKRRPMPGVCPGGGGCLSFDLTGTY